MNTVLATLYARVIRPVRDRLNLEHGLEAVEYALIAALLAVVVVTAVGLFGDGLTNIFNDIGQRLDQEGTNVLGAPGEEG